MTDTETTEPDTADDETLTATDWTEVAAGAFAVVGLGSVAFGLWRPSEFHLRAAAVLAALLVVAAAVRVVLRFRTRRAAR